MKFSVRLLYLYSLAFLGLVISIVGTVRLVDMGLKVYVFNEADKWDYYNPTPFPGEGSESAKIQKEMNDKQQIKSRQRDASTSISMIVVGLPLYLYHWSVIQKENKES